MTPNIGAELMLLTVVHPLARRTWPWTPTIARRGSVLVGPAGEKLLVRDDGGLDPVVEGGQPHAGIAADPTAGRTPEAA